MRTRLDPRDSPEMQVLQAVADGDRDAAQVATRTGLTVSRAQAILEWAVASGGATRLELPGGAAYTLTPKGLQLLGVVQGIEGAVDATGHVDLAAASRLVMEQYAGAHEVAEAEALRDQAGWPVDDAARDRVVSALSQAYADGALTKAQLDERSGRALAATTMVQLREAGQGVVELPPALPTGVRMGSTGFQVQSIHVNPALLKVRWSRVIGAGMLFVFGLVVLSIQALLGVVMILAAAAVGLWTLRPLLAGGTTTVNGRAVRRPGEPG